MKGGRQVNRKVTEMKVRCSERGKYREIKQWFCLCGKWLPSDGNTIRRNLKYHTCSLVTLTLPVRGLNIPCFLILCLEPRARIGSAAYWNVLERMEEECSNQLLMSAKGVGNGGWQYVCYAFANPGLGHILSELCFAV